MRLSKNRNAAGLKDSKMLGEKKNKAENDMIHKLSMKTWEQDHQRTTKT